MVRKVRIVTKRGPRGLRGLRGLQGVAGETHERVKSVEDAIKTLNREMGIVQGELTWIKILMVGVLGTGLAQLAWTIFGPKP